VPLKGGKVKQGKGEERKREGTVADRTGEVGRRVAELGLGRIDPRECPPSGALGE